MFVISPPGHWFTFTPLLFFTAFTAPNGTWSIQSRLPCRSSAIIESMPEPDGAPPPLPDVREVDGWVYSSLAVEAATLSVLQRQLEWRTAKQGSSFIFVLSSDV